MNKITIVIAAMMLTVTTCSFAQSTNTSSTPSTPSSAQTGPANPDGTFIFNPKNTTWYTYDANGNLIRTGHASGGSNYCRDLHRTCHTPVGTFRVYAKGDASCKSSIFPIGHPGAPMPWCMYFHGGFAVHGSYEVRSFNASHGCIRVYPADAFWLSHDFMHVGTVVKVLPYV